MLYGALETRRRTICATAAAAVALVAANPAHADEGGASVYLLGSGGPGAAVLPPLEGIFFENDLYYYDASASAERQFVIGGNLVAGLDATILADFASLAWVPTTNFAGGTLLVGAALPVGAPSVEVDAVITGPGGGTAEIRRSDRAMVVGDPLVTASLGWKAGDKTNLTLSSLVNIPIGHYREDQLANLAFHRWAFDLSGAVTWLDEKAGWDLSAKAGFTINGTNSHTDYNSGNDFHLEGAVEKKFSKAWSAGVQGYYYKQVSGDSGEGAKLGPFKGEVAGIGGTIAYNFIAIKTPVTARLKVLTEFGAKNRLEGTSVLFIVTTPLKLVLPPGAPGAAP
jgi:hypothetical protein